MSSILSKLPDLSLSRRGFVAGRLAIALVGPAYGQTAVSDRPLILGQVSLSFYAVTGAVVQAVLERLGHVVTVRQGPHEEMFPLLGAGEVDQMAAAWLPEGHRAYWDRFGGDAREVATLYEGACFFWGVPDYVPQDMVASISDLTQPEVAKRMVMSIQGIGDGAAISQLSRKVLTDYDLSGLGYVFRSGTQAEWIAAYRQAVEKREWIVFPT